MAAKYNETGYMYSSTRVRALENSIVGRERLEHLIEAKSTADIIAALPEYGFEIKYRDGAQTQTASEVLREETLLSVLENAYSDIDGMANSAHLLDFMRYQYDCNNIKSVIKCNSRGVDAVSMLSDLGTVPKNKVGDIVINKEYSLLPENMAKAVPQAIDAFNKTLNPQQVDLITDRACYADMLAAAYRLGVPYALRLVRAKIDLVNIIICIRVIRMKFGAHGKVFLEDALLDGGNLARSLFFDGYDGGEQKFFELLEHTDYSKLATSVGTDMPLNLLERAADDMWMEIAKEAKYVPFGIPVLIGYMVALEYEVKNIRIVMAGKDARLSPDVIRERLRASYV